MCKWFIYSILGRLVGFLYIRIVTQQTIYRIPMPMIRRAGHTTKPKTVPIGKLCRFFFIPITFSISLGFSPFFRIYVGFYFLNERFFWQPLYHTSSRKRYDQWGADVLKKNKILFLLSFIIFFLFGWWVAVALRILFDSSHLLLIFRVRLKKNSPKFDALV